MSRLIRERLAARCLLLLAIASVVCVAACGGRRRDATMGFPPTDSGTGTDANTRDANLPSGCDPDFGDCDSNPANGCETFLGTVEHCGACGTACDFGMACLAGVCRGAFPYTPSNFDLTGISSGPPITLDCGVSTFDSTTLTFTNWCDRDTPTPVVRTQTDGPDVVVLPVAAFTLTSDATLSLTGDRPVILAVYGDATIDGTLDASATGVTPGAGGNWTCGDSAGGNGAGSCSGGGGGGGGAGYSTAGAEGGRSGTRGTPGAARGNTTLSPLFGGCLGGNGGGCAQDVGGAGGGAIQLSVAGTLVINDTAQLLANGGNGLNGACNCSESGGGGGGSGGAILIEADNVTVAAGATLLTNGGNGGTGAGGPGGGSGGTWTTAPAAGSNSANGASGGGGSVGRASVRGVSSCTHTLEHVTLDGTCGT